jgi:hypothetical protein
LSRQCGILNISQPYRPLTACYGDSFTSFYLVVMVVVVVVVAVTLALSL